MFCLTNLMSSVFMWITASPHYCAGFGEKQSTTCEDRITLIHQEVRIVYAVGCIYHLCQMALLKSGCSIVRSWLISCKDAF